jgi:magnesium chelatase accessory protein
VWEQDKATWPLHELSRFVEVDGVNWHVQRAGTGPVMLLIHGTGASTHSWRGLIPRLAEHYTVVAVDLPGHGFTETRRGGCMSITGMSARLAALLRQLALDPIYCVGHSAGAVLPCQMALDHRIDPRLIIAINGAFLPLGGPAAFLYLPIARLLAGSPLVPRFVAWRAGNRPSVERMIGGTGSRLDAEGLDLYARLVRKPRHVAGALEMMANWDLTAFARRMPALATPLALIVAGNDRSVPPQQASFVQQRLPGVEVIRLAGLGHLAHEEQPGLVAREILGLCARHAPHPDADRSAEFSAPEAS